VGFGLYAIALNWVMLRGLWRITEEYVEKF